MTKAEEVIDALQDRFLCDCGTSYPIPPDGRYQQCPCDRCWGHALPVTAWHVEIALESFKFIDTETGWATWRR